MGQKLVLVGEPNERAIRDLTPHGLNHGDDGFRPAEVADPLVEGRVVVRSRRVVRSLGHPPSVVVVRPASRGRPLARAWARDRNGTPRMEVPMSPSTTAVPPTPPLFDEARLAIAGFLARYSGATRKSYATDLRQYFAWCAEVGLDVFSARRAHIELWARAMEERGLARATIGRRLSTIAGFYRFAVIDGVIEHSPAEYVRRPKIDTESATLGLDRMELGAFIAQGAAAGPVDHALACLLGLLGLRVSEASTSTSSTWPWNEAIAPSPCWAKAPSWR
jgi:hypothetical protein